jgi:large subunit ribosomal protein L13
MAKPDSVSEIGTWWMHRQDSGRMGYGDCPYFKGKNKTEYTRISMSVTCHRCQCDKVKVTVAARPEALLPVFWISRWMKSVTLAGNWSSPGWVINTAVKGMLPRGPLGRQMFRKLKVYAGPEHPHQAQQPEPLEL